LATSWPTTKVVELVGQHSELVRQLVVSSCWPTSCRTN